MLFAGMCQLTALRQVARVRHGSNNETTLVHRVAADVIPVEVGIDYGIESFRFETVRGHNFPNARRIGQAHPLLRPFVVAHSNPGLDQNPMVAVLHHKTVEGDFNAIQFVGGLELSP